MATTPIPPFWERLREISLYPFKGAAWISLVLYTLGSLLGWLPGIGWILDIVITVAAYRYAFEILVRTAHGHMDAPEFAAHTDVGVVWRFILMMLLYFLILLVSGLIAGPVLIWVLLLVMALLLPGAIMSLAMDGSLPKALNPATPLAIMSRIGAPYLAAAALLFVIQASASQAQDWLSQLLPALLASLLLKAIEFWGLFATFHLIGYLIWQYQEELGFEPGQSQLGPPPALRNRDSDLLDEAQALVADGQADAALERLREEMRERAVTADAHELYRKLLRSRDDKAALQQHAALYLNLLMLEKNQERRALALMRESLDMDRNFTTHQPEDGHRLACRARDLGQSQLALDIWLPMLKKWPKDPARVEWAVQAVPLLLQRERGGLARQMLQFISPGLEGEDKARIDALLQQLPAET